MVLVAAIAALVSFVLALLLHILSAGYADLFVLIGLVCVGLWMVLQHVGPLVRR